MIRPLATVVMLAALPAPVAHAQHAGQGAVVVNREVCSALVEHVPDADVEYEPGVDAKGRPVVPAEGDEHRFVWEPPESFAFRLIVDPDEFFASGPPDYADFVDDIPVGVVVVDHGEISVDGHPVTDPGRALIVRACRERLGGG